MGNTTIVQEDLPIIVSKSNYELCMKKYSGLYFGREENGVYWLKPTVELSIYYLKNILNL